MATKTSARDFSGVKKAIQRKRLEKLAFWSSISSDEAKANCESVITRVKECPDTFLGVLSAVALLEKPVLEVTSYRVNKWGSIEVEIGELRNVLQAGGASADEIKDLVWFRLFDFQDSCSSSYFSRWVSDHEPEKQIKKAERIGLYVYDFTLLPKSDKYAVSAVAPKVQLLIPDPPSAAAAVSPPSTPAPEKSKSALPPAMKEVVEEIVTHDSGKEKNKKRKLTVPSSQGDAGDKPAKAPKRSKKDSSSLSHDNPIIHGDGKEDAPIEDAIL